MRIVMRYGREGLPIELPDELDVTVIRKPEMPLLKQPREAVKAALVQPVGSRSLVEEAKGKRNVCILICDITRPVPNAIVLPPLIEALKDAGVDNTSITILVATGLHRPNEDEELRELVGDDTILNTVGVANHLARSNEDHVFLGTTPRGIPVKLDRRFIDADLRIAVGLVEPHFMAGYSGGRKVVIPGVAHHETIRALHATRILNQEKATNCVLDGNPVHEEQITAIRMVGRIFAVNTVIDERRRMSFVNFGVIEESHLQTVSFVEPYMMVPVDRRYATVVTSSAGYPLDRNYYQTVKGMVGVADILEPGGNLFIVSHCSEGLGTHEYAEAQARLIQIGEERFVEETSLKQFASIDEWESIMQIKATRMGAVHLYSTCLTPEERSLTGVRLIESVEKAIVRSVEEKHDKRVAVVPEGPYVIPVYRPQSPES